MSIFYCNRCGCTRDSDWVEVVDDPKNKHELMCLDHQEEDDEKPLATENEGK